MSHLMTLIMTLFYKKKTSVLKFAYLIELLVISITVLVLRVVSYMGFLFCLRYL